MPLKEIQCAKKKANILLLSTLSYNNAEINETIDILEELIQRLDQDDYIFENKVVMAKEDWLII